MYIFHAMHINISRRQPPLFYMQYTSWMTSKIYIYIRCPLKSRDCFTTACFEECVLRSVLWNVLKLGTAAGYSNVPVVCLDRKSQVFLWQQRTLRANPFLEYIRRSWLSKFVPFWPLSRSKNDFRDELLVTGISFRLIGNDQPNIYRIRCRSNLQKFIAGQFT